MPPPMSELSVHADARRASSSITTDVADHVLRLKQMAQPKACYACYKRKVKCDHSHPCGTCVKRGHPEICTYTFDLPSRKRPGTDNTARLPKPRRPKTNSSAGSPEASSVARSRSSRPTRSQASSLAISPQDSWQSSYAESENGVVVASTTTYSEASPANLQPVDDEQPPLGDGYLINTLRQRATASRVLGLENTVPIYPFMDENTQLERWAALVEIAPRQDEVSEFFPPYRSSIHAFNPIIVDIDMFEADFCRYLDALAEGELKDPNQISKKWFNEKSIAHIALLLATLSSGSQFSVADPVKRSELCSDFARRAFKALRLANFLFRPSLDIIQALLVMVNLLQNKGQSDGAWSLLGTTIRLAQSLGLHRESLARQPENVGAKARTIWTSIVWQDTFLSLCLGQTPIVSNRRWVAIPADRLLNADLSYTEVMRGFVSVLLDFISMEDEPDLELSQRMLSTLDDYYEHASPHLRSREKCRSLHQRLEHFGLRIHLSTSILAVCRPAVKNKSQEPKNQRLETCAIRAEKAMIDAQVAFLDFQKMSTVPLRTWSMAQTVLRATLILCMWEKTRRKQECRALQQQVIDVFSSAITTSYGGSGDDATAPHCHWLSERHLFAIVALQKATNKSPCRTPPEGDSVLAPLLEPTQPTMQTDSAFGAFPDSSFDPGFLSMLGDGFNSAESPYGWGLDGHSPVSYVDNILSGSLPDFTEFNGFF